MLLLCWDVLLEMEDEVKSFHFRTQNKIKICQDKRQIHSKNTNVGDGLTTNKYLSTKIFRSVPENTNICKIWDC